jgi:hypothetical protein
VRERERERERERHETQNKLVKGRQRMDVF